MYIDPSFASDHAIPHFTLKDSCAGDKGPGYWKLNVKHLYDEDYCNMVKDILEECDEIFEIKKKWEMIKMKIRGESIKFGAQKKKSQENILEALQVKLYKIMKDRDNLVSDKEATDDYTIFKDHETQIIRLQKDKADLVQSQTEKAALRNSANWMAFGGKSSKYFFALENKFPRKPLSRIQIGNRLVEDKNVILDELVQYYKKLFTAIDSEDSQDIFAKIQLPQVKEEDYEMLESPITLEEIEIAIRQLSTDKCPALDGYPIEFYQKCLGKIKHTHHSLYIKIVEDQEFNDSARLGVISLLEKVGKDQLQISNWQPLTLLGSDFKIFTKILANRMSIVSTYLIHPDQSGFLKGRFIAENLMDINMVVNSAAEAQVAVTITAIDFEKAYDTVSWSALKKILQAFGFGSKFINGIWMER